MTLPDLSAIVPSKWKTWTGLLGALLSFVAPFTLEATQALPAPWPALIGVFLALLTALGIYHAPYKPTGTTLAVDPTTPVALPTSNPMDPRIALPDPGTVVDRVPVTEADVSDRPQYPWK